MEKHFVSFYSPSTIVPEVTEKPIDSWDVELAQEMAHSVLERHNATPYAFRFSTRSRGDDDLDSHVTSCSPIYFLGGQIETLAQVEARADPKEAILRSNMRNSDCSQVIINDNSWRAVLPFNKGDVLLNWMPRSKEPKNG